MKAAGKLVLPHPDCDSLYSGAVSNNFWYFSPKYRSLHSGISSNKSVSLKGMTIWSIGSCKHIQIWCNNNDQIKFRVETRETEPWLHPFPDVNHVAIWGSRIAMKHATFFGLGKLLLIRREFPDSKIIKVACDTTHRIHVPSSGWQNCGNYLKFSLLCCTIVITVWERLKSMYLFKLQTQARNNGEGTQGVLFTYVITYVLFNYYIVFTEIFINNRDKYSRMVLHIVPPGVRLSRVNGEYGSAKRDD